MGISRCSGSAAQRSPRKTAKLAEHQKPAVSLGRECRRRRIDCARFRGLHQVPIRRRRSRCVSARATRCRRKPSQPRLCIRAPIAMRPSCSFPSTSCTILGRRRSAACPIWCDDLHFHDLRHEGTSRLFEVGFSIEQVALVSGHKSHH